MRSLNDISTDLIDDRIRIMEKLHLVYYDGKEITLTLLGKLIGKIGNGFKKVLNMENWMGILVPIKIVVLSFAVFVVLHLFLWKFKRKSYSSVEDIHQQPVNKGYFILGGFDKWK